MTALSQDLSTRQLPAWVRDSHVTEPAHLGGRETGARHAARAVAIASAVSFVGSVLSVLILAHYLSPAEFGLMAMVAPLVVFLLVVSEAGLGTHTMQSDRLDANETSLAFWITLTASVALCLVFIAASPGMAWLFGTAEVAPIAAALSGLFILNGVKAQHDAICRRCMRQDLWAWASGTGSVASLIAAIVLAKGGAGVWALVGMMLTRTATHAALIWAFTGWIPARPRWSVGVPGLLRFGGAIVTAQVIAQSARVIDKVLLGWAKGAVALGHYHLAFQMMLVPLIQLQYPVQSLAIPYLRAARHDDDAFRTATARLAAGIALLVWPVMVAAAVTADLVIPVLFGTAWSASAPIFALLALSSLGFVVRQVIGWALEARGDAAGALRWHAIAVAALVVGMLAGLPWGGVGVATGLVVSETALLVTAHRLIPGAVGKAIGAIGAALVRPAAVAMLGAVAAAKARMIADGAADGVRLATFAILMLTVGVVSVWQAQTLFRGEDADAPADPAKDPAKADRPSALAL